MTTKPTTKPTLDLLVTQLLELSGLPADERATLRAELQRQLTTRLLAQLPHEQQSGFLRLLQRGETAGLERYLQRYVRDLRGIMREASRAAVAEIEALYDEPVRR